MKWINSFVVFKSFDGGIDFCNYFGDVVLIIVYYLGEEIVNKDFYLVFLIIKVFISMWGY